MFHAIDKWLRVSEKIRKLEVSIDGEGIVIR
jgi:hypothetical protein